MDLDRLSARFPAPLLLLAMLPFVVLCTMNSASYRYGASDQAFYIPAVVLEMHPDHFPRDAAVIRAQATLTLVDDAMGRLSSVSDIGLPALSFGLYVGSLLLLAMAAWAIATRLYRTRWGAVALLAALTLRHSISRTGTNTLEGYFHPRQLSFGLGALGVAFILRRRVLAAVVAVLLAGTIHPTTALWFAIWLAIAVAINEPQWRRVMTASFVAAGVAALWTLTAGPLAGRLVVMDPEWLATLDTKDYLFPLEWPAATWLFNLAYVATIAAIYRWRRAVGVAADVETGVALGALALVVVFAAVLPFNAAHVALAVQLQSSRMFWMLDFLATIYIVWAIAEGTAPTAARSQRAAAALLFLSLVRGSYVKFVEFPLRPLAQIDIPDNDWGRAMAWARATDIRSHWLADPIHAARYGMSLRVAGERDVFVEGIKDAAIGMYDRSIAIRTRDRLAAIGNFDVLTADRARSLAATYDIDYLLAERPFDLPLGFQSGKLRIYRVR